MVREGRAGAQAGPAAPAAIGVPVAGGGAYLWGLAANGSAGVKKVFDVLRGGIDSTLLALGRPAIHDLSADDIIVPADFALGVSK